MRGLVELHFPRKQLGPTPFRLQRSWREQGIGCTKCLGSPQLASGPARTSSGQCERPICSRVFDPNAPIPAGSTAGRVRGAHGEQVRAKNPGYVTQSSEQRQPSPPASGRLFRFRPAVLPPATSTGSGMCGAVNTACDTPHPAPAPVPTPRDAPAPAAASLGGQLCLPYMVRS